MAKEQLIEAGIWTVARTERGNVVLVKPFGSERAVPIFIRQLEAHSILMGLENVSMPRPLTHDLMVAIMEQLFIKVERIDITGLRDGIFYSTIRLKQRMKRFSIDARPSDALGIVARVHCPLYIAQSIVEEAGVAISLISEEEGAGPPIPEEKEKETELTRLQRQLQHAVDEEDYETAARIRDKIQKWQ